MPRRMAAAMAMLVFAICLIIGGLQADNPFATTVLRALLAMAGTFVVALVLGFMAQKMLEENVRTEEKKAQDSGAKPAPNDR